MFGGVILPGLVFSVFFGGGPSAYSIIISLFIISQQKEVLAIPVESGEPHCSWPCAFGDPGTCSKEAS